MRSTEQERISRGIETVDQSQTIRVPLGPSKIFWGSLCLLALVSAIAVLSTSRLINVYSASSHSQDALLELDRFLSELKDIEAGARGYALTRDPALIDT